MEQLPHTKQELLKAESTKKPYLRVDVARTAAFIAAGRAVETERGDDALINDPWAREFAGEYGFTFLSRLARYQLYGGERRTARLVGVRTKFFDDFATESAQHHPIRQIVMPGSGFDTRAYRLKWPPNVTVFEIDYPEIFEEKRRVLRRVSPSCHRLVFIEADLRESLWETRLLEAGYKPELPSAWLLEGLLMYLQPIEYHRLFDSLCRLCASSSRIAGDFFNKALVHSAFSIPVRDTWAEWGAPIVSGTDSPQSILKLHGFDSVSVTTYADKIVDDEPPEAQCLYSILPKDNSLPQTLFVTASRSSLSAVNYKDWEMAFWLEEAKNELTELQKEVPEEKLHFLEGFFRFYEKEQLARRMAALDAFD